jgi:hypothetical protein
MFSSVRRHLTYANVTVTFALVFAMSGGAYAAGKYLVTSTKQISPKVLKSLQGKAGVAGKNGAAGPAGPVGPAGAQGLQGAKGETGATGSAGTDGTNGTNGKEGKEGKEGSPWTAGGTLPAGQMLKGEWSLAATVSGSFSRLSDSISYGIPLATPAIAHYINENGQEMFVNTTTMKTEERSPVGCPGSVSEPQAEAGNLCVYASHEENNHEPFMHATQELTVPTICFASGYAGGCLGVTPQPEKFGFSVYTASEEEGFVNDAGTWAVTEAEE